MGSVQGEHWQCVAGQGHPLAAGGQVPHVAGGQDAVDRTG